MKRLARRLVALAAPALERAFVFTVRWSGIPCLLRNTFGRNRVAILAYHDPKPEVLERHLRYLSRRHAFVTMDAVVRAANSGDWRSIPPKCLVVTLDDGHRGNVELVDVFQRYGVVPTVFACTQIVGTHRHYWWTSCSAAENLKRVPNAERLQTLRAREGFTQTLEYPDRQALTVEEVRLMSAHVDFGSHTRFHPILPMCTLEESREEIVSSKLEIERMTGKPCRHFSYPNGNYSMREVALLKASGYESARTINPGWNRRDGDLFTLKIIGAPDEGSVNHLAASVVTLFVKRLVTRLAGGVPAERPLPPAPEGAR